MGLGMHPGLMVGWMGTFSSPFQDLYYCFSLPKGNKVDCMTDIGWGEFDRITTRGLGEVREMLRNFFEIVPMLKPVEDDI